MNNITALLTFLSGKKTYLTIGAIGVLLFGVWQGWWKVPDEVYLALMALALAFLRNSISKSPPPPPPAVTGDPPKLPGAPLATLMAIMPWLRPFMAAFALTTVLFVTGCAPLQPGADPLVVNVERAELVGKSTFDLILNVDNSNRSYWATNAPAFHEFCQWLRQRQTIERTNTLPRCVAMVLSLDDVKLDYKAARSSSNALTEALATFSSVLNQATSWSNVILPQNPEAKPSTP
jgi:hypothetical protein